MARILVTSMPFAGHVGPTAAVAGALIRAGHEVVAYSGAKRHPASGCIPRPDPWAGYAMRHYAARSGSLPGGCSNP
jgi:hypothetical protein